MSTYVDTKCPTFSTNALSRTSTAIRTFPSLTPSAISTILATLSLRNTTIIPCRITYITAEPLSSFRTSIKITFATLPSSPIRIATSTFCATLTITIELVQQILLPQCFEKESLNITWAFTSRCEQLERPYIVYKTTCSGTTLVSGVS